MNLLLLSGGSGKRLWPLSNDVCSKQFLWVLTDEEGNRQSMAQRVTRQIKAVQPGASLTVVAGAAQLDAIQSQLGEEMDVVLEPQRRDTFPAIALACAHFAYEKGVGMDEVVIVLPVDTYVEPGYYRLLGEMEAAIRENYADIMLMGVKPSFPSVKYGYIVPKAKGQAGRQRVERFAEKPSQETARQLLAQGAVWNGGVFAFRLGHMMDIAHRDVEFNSYAQLYERFGQMEKTSFDYKVLEHAPSVGMVLYDGTWKDLGTWATLTEEMGRESMGNVIMAEQENTYAINELSIPLVVLGTKNTVVAASPDGILVSEIDASARIKPHVEQIGLRPMYEERRWGEYTAFDSVVYEDDSQSLVKHIMLKPGKCISYQSHMHRSEVWVITSGQGLFVLDGVARRVGPGEVLRIPQGAKHCIRAESNLHLIEVQMGTQLVEGDIVRYQWNWEELPGHG